MEDGWYLLEATEMVPPHVTHDELRALEWVTDTAFAKLVRHGSVKLWRDRSKHMKIYRFHWV